MGPLTFAVSPLYLVVLKSVFTAPGDMAVLRCGDDVTERARVSINCKAAQMIAFPRRWT